MPAESRNSRKNWTAEERLVWPGLAVTEAAVLGGGTAAVAIAA
jgi:hypothetical protein